MKTYSLKKILLSVVAITVFITTTQTHTFAAVTSSIYKPAGLTKNGLVVWYTFDTPDTSSSVSTNKMGTGNDGVNNGFLALGAGKAGEAITFDGGVRNVAITNNVSIQLDTLTVSVWMKTSGAGSGSRSIMAKPNAFGMLLGGGCADNVFGIYDWSTASSVCSSAPEVNDNQWHNYICTFQSGVTNGTICYKDGKAILTGTYTTVNHGSNINIGSNAGSQYITASIDEARIYNRILSSSEIYSLANSPTSLGVITNKNMGVSSGPILWWTFDGKNLTSSTSTDSSGTGNDGTLNVTTPVMGKIGQGMSFNGSTSYVRGKNIVNIPKVTLSTWVYLTAYPGSNSLIGGFSNGVANIVEDKNLYINSSGKAFFYVFDGALKTTSTPTPVVPLNKWTHLVGTADGTNAYLYMNGVLVGSVAAGNTYVSYNVPNIFAGGSAGSKGYLSQRLDDFRVYDRALSASEVLALYKLGGVVTK